MQTPHCGARALLAAAVLSFAAAPVTAKANPSHAVDVPPGIRIAAKLDERLSSGDSKPGQIFVFETTLASRAGSIDIPAGTLGHGVVTTAERAAGTRPGKLALALISIDLPDGRDVPVKFATGSALHGVGDSVKAMVIPVPLAGGLGFLGGGSRATNFNLPNGSRFIAETASSSPGPAHPSGSP